MVGYTALSQKDETHALHLLKKHDEMLRSSLSDYRGKEVKTMGDAFLLEFESALDAVRYAIDIQQRLHEHNLTANPENSINVRIGIHVGDIVHRGTDVLGDAVNISSRIEPLAESGGVCVSQQVYDQVWNKISFPLTKAPSRKLKNVALFIDTYKIDFPWEKATQASLPARVMKLDRLRLAVLPFRNMSPDPNDDYFAEGMTEELITTLSGIRELTVIARTSVMPYKGVAKRVDEIGHELGAGTLIEGSVRKVANKVRVSVQVIDAENEGHLWAQNYDKDLNDIFAIQSEIAEKVAENLRVKLLSSEKERLETAPTTNTEAYTLYLKGRHYWNKRSEEGTERAIECFNEAVKIDPNFALGYSGLAGCYVTLGHNSMAESEPSYRMAKEYALKALALDVNLAEAHVALAGVLADYEHQWLLAESEFKRAIELKPSYSTAHQWYGLFVATLGRLDEAESEIRKAFDLDPLSLIIGVNVGDSLYYRGEYLKALEQYKRVIEKDPTFAVAYVSMIQACVQSRMYEEGLRAAEKYAILTSRPAWGKVLRAYVFAAMGKNDESRKLLKEVEQDYQRQHINPYDFALACFQMGDDNAGFGWLEKAFTEHDTRLMLMTIDFELERLRSHPRYITLLNKLNLSHVRPRT